MSSLRLRIWTTSHKQFEKDSVCYPSGCHYYSVQCAPPRQGYLHPVGWRCNHLLRIPHHLDFADQQQHVLHFIPCHVVKEGNFNDQPHTNLVLLKMKILLRRNHPKNINIKFEFWYYYRYNQVKIIAIKLSLWHFNFLAIENIRNNECHQSFQV